MPDETTDTSTTDGPVTAEEIEAEASEQLATAHDAGGEDPAATGQDGETGDDDSPNREAARYRRQLREAEAERDTLRGHVEEMQRREAGRIATEGEDALADAADLWRGEVQLADLLDDAGALDAEKVAEARDRVVAGHPHWRRPHRPSGGDGGARGSARVDPAEGFNRRLRNAGQ